MKQYIIAIFCCISLCLSAQQSSEVSKIETTLNNYLDAFYKGDTTKLKAAITPRLYKFGYWKNKATGKHEYYDQMTYDKAMAFVAKVKTNNRIKSDSIIRKIEVLDVGAHIASAKITGYWGVDYALLSKDNNTWLIEQIIWEGPLETPAVEQPTTYYLIRHAEKDRSDKTNRNPHLTEAGKKRAIHWANVLKDVELDMVFSTDYHRTKETALPTAKAHNLELQIYDPRSVDIKQFMQNTKGKNILIVGHSNTTPLFVNALLNEKKYPLIADDNNANLYIVTVTSKNKISYLLSVDTF